MFLQVHFDAFPEAGYHAMRYCQARGMILSSVLYIDYSCAPIHLCRFCRLMFDYTKSTQIACTLSILNAIILCFSSSRLVKAGFPTFISPNIYKLGITGTV